MVDYESFSAAQMSYAQVLESMRISLGLLRNQLVTCNASKKILEADLAKVGEKNQELFNRNWALEGEVAELKSQLQLQASEKLESQRLAEKVTIQVC